MSGDCSGELLRAIRARMLADAGLIAEVGARIYETVPDGATLPCIALNDATLEASDTDTSSGAVHSLRYSVFARGEAARVDVRRIGAALIAAVDRSGQFLSVSGHRVVLVRYVRNVVFRSDDQTNGEAHGVYSFEAITENETATAGY